MDVRAAIPADAEHVIQLAHARRSDLAAWAPVYFNPSAGADDAHGWFLEFIIGSPDHATYVVTADSRVVGFFVVIAQPSHVWVDDLCLEDPTLWPELLEAIDATVAEPWVTCVPSLDHVRTVALLDHGMTTVSNYWAGPVRPADDPVHVEPVRVEVDPSVHVASHTFGGQPFSPDVEGAFVLRHDGGYVIGSPSSTPPIFDPGGPTTVVDQVVGSDRRGLVVATLLAAGRRGDAQLVVVVDASDVELARIVEDLGLVRVVDLLRSTAV